MESSHMAMPHCSWVTQLLTTLYPVNILLIKRKQKLLGVIFQPFHCHHPSISMKVEQRISRVENGLFNSLGFGKHFPLAAIY